MTEIRFPRRREDGSFLLVARFSSTSQVSELVDEYVKAWRRANQVWTRIWRSDRIEEERLEFDAEFSSEPSVEKSPSGFAVLLECRPSSKRWKDWAVFMVDDISTVFPEVEFVGFE